MPDDRPSAAEDRDLLAEAARAAGAIALGFFKKDPQVWTKDNDSPVSEADFAVDRYLAEALRSARPDYGWLSEETEDAPERLAAARVFIVDPIDGTRSFVAGGDEWTISVAVVEAGRPTAAALYRPTSDTMWDAIAGGGARIDGAALSAVTSHELDGLRVAGPRGTIKQFLGSDVKPAETAFIASLALRIALVASGRYDLILSKENAHDWDIAAADLILDEAGGILCDDTGARLVYNRNRPNHPALIGGARGTVGAALPLFARR